MTMKNIIDIGFSYYFDSKEIEDFKKYKIGQYKISAEKIPKPASCSGGPIWYGILIFIPMAIATGFLNEFGKDLYFSIKEKLFLLKGKIGKVDHSSEDLYFPEHFTVTITGHKYITDNFEYETRLVFCFDNVNKLEDFERALDAIKITLSKINLSGEKGVTSVWLEYQGGKWKITEKSNF